MSRPDEQTRKVSWDMVRRSAKAGAGERVLQVSTKCRSVDELLSRFAPFATADSLTVPAREGIALGERLVMKVALADNTEVFSARGEVVEVKAAGKGAVDIRPVVRVRLIEMDEDSQALFLSLSRQASGIGPPVTNDERTVIPTGTEDTEQNQPAVPVRPPPPANKPAFGQPRSFVAKGSLPLPPTRREAPTRRPPTPSPARSRSSVPTASPPAPSLAPVIVAAAPAEPERAPGSAYKLPANPLAELNVDAVKSFVDCNLYESDGHAPPPDEATRRAEGPEALTTTEEVDDENLELLRAAAMSAREDSTDPPGLSAGGGGRLAAAWASAHRQFNRLPSPLRRTLVQALPFAFCTMLGWCVGFNMAGLPARGRQPTSGVPPMPEATAVAVPGGAPRPTVATPIPKAAPAALPVPSKAPDPPSPAGAAAPTPAPGGNCLATFDVRPAGVSVKWGAEMLGTAPLPRAAVPCGPARVVFERERWETVARQVEAKPGEGLHLSIKLNRPPAFLTVNTTPPGATIQVNGLASGKTPRKLALRRYETVKLDLRLEGHRSWHTEVYLKSQAETFNAQLDPLTKSKPVKPAAPK